MANFIYRIKIMVRSRSLLFWSFAFPVFLGLMFYLLFGGIDEAEQFLTVPIGVVNGQENPLFMETLKEADTEEGAMFAITEYPDEEAALQALKDDEIRGIVDAAGDLELTVKESSIGTSLIKIFLDQYKQNTAMFVQLSREGIPVETLAGEMSQGVMTQINEIPLKGTDKSPYNQYFYALLAMTCLIAAMVGATNSRYIQANQSEVAARRNVVPMAKMKLVLIDFFSAWLVYGILATLVLGVCIFVYGRDFGSNTGMILLTTWAGCFTGLAGGTMIGIYAQGNEQMQNGIVVTFFMVSSFLGGLQWGNITDLLEQYCPVINRINPATLIVNAYKSLAVFGDMGQYAQNLGTLLAIGVLFLILSIGRMRRVKYASI